MPAEFPIFSEGLGSMRRITSLLIKPVSALCNLDCAYCFYLDRRSRVNGKTGRACGEPTLYCRSSPVVPLLRVFKGWPSAA